VGRKGLALAGFVTGVLATAFYRRWSGEDGERLDLYFDDGSFVTFVAGSSTAERLLPLAAQVLAAAGRRP